MLLPCSNPVLQMYSFTVLQFMQDAWEAAEAEVGQSAEATQPAGEVSGTDFL